MSLTRVHICIRDCTEEVRQEGGQELGGEARKTRSRSKSRSEDKGQRRICSDRIPNTRTDVFCSYVAWPSTPRRMIPISSPPGSTILNSILCPCPSSKLQYPCSFRDRPRMLIFRTSEDKTRSALYGDTTIPAPKASYSSLTRRTGIV